MVRFRGIYYHYLSIVVDEKHESFTKPCEGGFRKMVDALIEGLEARLHHLEEGLYELDELVSGEGNRAVRARNELKLELAWDLFKAAFGRDPAIAELSRITSLSAKSINSILKSEDFNHFVKSVRKTTVPKYLKRLGASEGFPILVERRLGRPTPGSSVDKGRPNVMYAETDGGLPGALALLSDLFSKAGERLRHDPDFAKEVEVSDQLEREENKRELAWIIGHSIDEAYIAQATGAVAHRLFEIYALPATGRVFSYSYGLVDDIDNKLLDVVRVYLRKPNRSESLGEVEAVAKDQREKLHRMESVGRFSELAATARSHTVASAYWRWMNSYRLFNWGKQIDEFLVEAHEKKRDVSELTDTAFDLIKEQVLSIIVSYVTTPEPDKASA